MNSRGGKLLLCMALVSLPGCTDGGKTGGKFGTLPVNEVCQSFTTGGDKIKTLPSGVKYEDTKEGTGAVAEDGKSIIVHYTGYLVDGTVFDSSLRRGQPFPIKGWDLGLVGMKEGGKRKLLIPTDLAYANQRMGSIPPNSDLIFEVELVKVN